MVIYPHKIMQEFLLTFICSATTLARTFLYTRLQITTFRLAITDHFDYIFDLKFQSGNGNFMILRDILR